MVMLSRSRLSLRLSPLVAFVDRSGADGELRHGAFHRLTGDGFEIPPPLRELFILLRKTPLDLRDLDRYAGPGGRWLLDALRERHFLVSDAEPARLLQPFLTGRAVRPAMNPAVFVRGSGGGAGARVVRLERADRCALPRTSATPEVVDEPLSPVAAALLALATTNGALSLAETLDALRGRVAGGQLSSVWEAIDFLTQPQRQLLRLVPTALATSKRPGLRHHYLNQSFVRSPASTAPAASGHYRDGIDDAAWNFDWVESTVSHAFRYPTAALEAQSYGERLCQSILGNEGLVTPPSGRPLEVLEVGGGTGAMARDFIRRARQLLGDGAALRYTILDCSPSLLKAQRAALADAGCAVRFVEGDACDLMTGPADERFDLILANEVIADLPVSGPVERREQSGSRLFLEQLAARLRTEGAAVVIEYGSLDDAPQLVEHLNHPEHSIQFGPLLAQARSLGLGARLVPLHDLLQSRREAEMACGQQEHVLCLNHLLAGRGVAVPYAAFCRAEFERRFGDVLNEVGVVGLPYAPLAQGLHFGPDLAQFQALVLDGPGRGRPQVASP